MLVKFIPSLKNNKIINWLERFLCSPFYIIFVALLLVISEIFSIELIIYYLLMIISIIIPALLIHDMTPAVPFLVMIHIAVSKNTLDKDKTVFLNTHLGAFLVFAIITALFLFARLIFDLITEPERRKYPRFLIGYIAILVAYSLGGLFTDKYSFDNFAFGIREFISISFLYFYFVYAIDWKKFKKDYFAYLFTVFGVAVSIEALIIILQGKTLETGWGISNDIGATIAFCIPASAYLIIKHNYKINWIYTLITIFLIGVVMMTLSRSSCVAAILLGITSFVFVYIYGDKISRITTTELLSSFAIAGILIIVFNDYFSRLIDFNFNDINEFSTYRIRDWKIGMEHFSSNPIFGVGWFECTWREHNFPPRYHNTYVQLLGATGLLGLLSYLFHRFETMIVTFKKPTLEKTFAFLCILSLMTANFFDNYFFNIWFGLGYSFLLAVIENDHLTIN